MVRCKKKAQKWRAQIRKLLGFVKRDIRVIQKYLDDGYVLSNKHQIWWETIKKIYEQQLFMYDHRTHSVADRIVNFHQPWIRPIVREKAKAAVEFGAKFDMSVDNGIARLDRTSLDAYNESEVLVLAIRRYHDRHGCYPKRVLADKIYRNRNNLAYCKDRRIRLSGPALGRPKKNTSRDKTIEHQDNADRVEVERGFSLMKRCFSAGLIRTKRRETTLTSIALSVIAMNLSKLTADFLRQIFSWSLSFRKTWSKSSDFTCYEYLVIIQ